MKKVQKNKRDQKGKAAFSRNILGIDDKCAGCGEDYPEYVLEDRQLCLDCYAAEEALLR